MICQEKNYNIIINFEQKKKERKKKKCNSICFIEI